MIFLKAIIFACAVCFLGNLIICLVWKKSSSLMFEFLPYLLAFFSLSILFFIKILPYHPIWLLSPIGMQILLIAGTNFFSERGMDYFEKSDKESIFSFLQLFFINIKNKAENYINENEFFQQQDGYIPDQEEYEYEYIPEIESTEEKILEVAPQKKTNILESNSEGQNKFIIESKNGVAPSSSIKKTSDFEETTQAGKEEPKNIHDDSLYEQVNESSEILFLQADICFVQGDIKENKKILFYIYDKYKGTEIGNRAKKELLRLYGQGVFLEERLNIE